MNLCRFQPVDDAANRAGGSGPAAASAALHGAFEGGSVFEIRGDLFGSCERTGRAWVVGDVKFLPPSVPTKVVAVGRNYHEHVKEFNNPVPKDPIIFLKPPSSILAPEGPIVLPVISNRVEFEGELALVIGRRCFHIRPEEDVNRYILGYTALNDVTARDLQRADGQWSRGKSFDTFCPFGPVLQTNPPAPETRVETRVNGEIKQSATVADMIFPIDFLMRWITQVMTLEPGDVIATGTPGGVGPLVAGDIVEVSVSGAGTLRNSVAPAQP